MGEPACAGCQALQRRVAELEVASYQGIDDDDGALGSMVPLPTNPDFSTWPVYRWLMARIGPVDGIPVVFIPEHIDHANALIAPPGNRMLILISSETTQWTLAHELGHALVNQTPHDGERNHVMHPTVDISVPPLSAPIFTPEQVQRIYRSPFCVPA